MFSKKSMIASQLFIYIITILVFSLIMVYGYNAVKGFRGRAEQIASINFKTELISAIRAVSPDYGTVKKEEFFIGGEYTQVCFVQSYKQEENTNLPNSIDNLVMRDSVKSKVNKNTFLFTNSLQESFDIGKINVSNNNEGYLRIDIINGKAKIQFEGKGDHTLISKWG